MPKSKLFLSIFLILNVSVFSATLHVPSEYENIQTAIAFATDGDSINVSNGTYSGYGKVNINF
mgnify:CR=1 FL=1